MRSGAAAGHPGYFHETAFYGSDDEFVDIVAPFVRDGIAAGEPTVVACGPRLGIAGSTEPSTTHSPATPRTRQRGSTTAAASPSTPIGADPHRCCEVDHCG